MLLCILLSPFGMYAVMRLRLLVCSTSVFVWRCSLVSLLQNLEKRCCPCAQLLGLEYLKMLSHTCLTTTGSVFISERSYFFLKLLWCSTFHQLPSNLLVFWFYPSGETYTYVGSFENRQAINCTKICCGLIRTLLSFLMGLLSVRKNTCGLLLPDDNEDANLKVQREHPAHW